MATTRKPRPAAAAPAAGKTAAKPAAVANTASKAAAEFQRFKATRAAATEAGATPSPAAPAASAALPPMSAMPSWAMPPAFSLPQPPQGWGAMMPQPGVVQPAPLAVGPLGDRLGSTLRLGIDVINMALAGSLRLLGGMGYGGYEPSHGGQCGCGHPAGGHYGGHNCCHVFEHDDCCTPSVGNCCD